jgi:ribosome biogenesis GTPase A
MAGYMDLVERVIDGSDVILMVVDARDIKRSSNRELEELIKSKGKKLLYVVNKCDLITKVEQSKINLPCSVQVSATKHWGNMRLLKKIKELTRGEAATIGVVGYPNTGKSTLINALKGKHSAPTSAHSGFTRHMQRLKIGDGLYLFDTPGVFSESGESDLDHMLIGAKDGECLKDPEQIVVQFIGELNGKVESHYDVAKHKDPYETLEEIAIKKKFLKKGGLPDTVRASRQVIKEWQRRKTAW